MFSGKTANIRKRIFDLSIRNTLSKHGSVFRGLRQGTAGSIKKKARDSLERLPREGVSSNLIRQSQDGRS
jgi:hypothetical protein